MVKPVWFVAIGLALVIGFWVGLTTFNDRPERRVLGVWAYGGGADYLRFDPDGQVWREGRPVPANWRIDGHVLTSHIFNTGVNTHLHKDEDCNPTVHFPDRNTMVLDFKDNWSETWMRR